jgi:hypothetical protein
MKRLFLHLQLVVCLMLLFGCATTKKHVESVSTATVVEQSTANAKSESSVEKVVDTTKTITGKVTITEIVFDTTPDVAQESDSARNRGQPETTTTGTATHHKSTITLSTVGNINGVVKSIRQMVIESNVTEKGESRESQDQNESKSNASALQKENTETTKATTTPIKPWFVVIGVAAIAAIILLYLKRQPIINWIKTILSGLRRIFTKN